MELFRRLLTPAPADRVLDVGCGPAESGLAALAGELRITGLDKVNRPGYEGPSRRFVQGDARALPFADGEFEIAYSNSVIEHVDPADRPRFAAELMRVANRWFVQTPARSFPVEPHVLIPFFQHLPRRARRALWRFGASKDEFHDIPLLSETNLMELFPGSVLVRERFLGMTKSLIAVGGQPTGRIPSLNAASPGASVSERSGTPAQPGPGDA